MYHTALSDEHANVYEFLIKVYVCKYTVGWTAGRRVFRIKNTM